VTVSLLLQLLASGIAIGLVYSLVAAGLTLIWGVMDLVNFAHGEYLMVAMYSAYWLATLFHLDPLVSWPVTTLIMSGFGAATYYLIVRRLLTASIMAQVFATFGLVLFLQAGAQFLFGPEFRSIPNPAFQGRIDLMGVYLGQDQIVAGLGAFLVSATLHWFLRYTDLGRALDATSQDRGAAAAMGIDTDKMFLLAWVINGGLLGIAGSLVASSYSIQPLVGQVFVLIAFVVVALGGFGSVQGAFVAGVLVGIFQTLSSYLLPSQFEMIPVYFAYLVILLLRPQGLLGNR